MSRGLTPLASRRIGSAPWRISISTCRRSLRFFTRAWRAVVPFEFWKLTLAPWRRSRSAALKRLHLIAERKGVASSTTGSRRAPAFTRRSMASTLSSKPAVQRQFSGVEPRFSRNFASGRFRPRESAYQSGVALKAPPSSTKAGSLTSKPRSRRSRASARERVSVLSLAGSPQRKWSALRRRSSFAFASSGWESSSAETASTSRDLMALKSRVLLMASRLLGHAGPPQHLWHGLAPPHLRRELRPRRDEQLHDGVVVAVIDLLGELRANASEDIVTVQRAVDGRVERVAAASALPERGVYAAGSAAAEVSSAPCPSFPR